MTWYVASVIMSIRRKDGRQKNIPVYENFILIEEESCEQAISKVKDMAVEEARIASERLTLNDKPAYMFFEGVRKLIKISNPPNIDLDAVPPVSGTELTYSEYLVKNKKQIKKLVQGKSIKLKYID
ncbi:DUF4288 domain-containing protein [Salmonella enterica]|uniref:DUF4288 domain-containing protein n=1 Tax=Salmonella enterica TaxID=28901 RepID=A0A702E4N0_SALER|nr:DUF4288 domain-containing protein [Salmonella enterica]HAC6565543.1 hypothetical protein [Salmonella enterica subsp. indica]HBC0160374.1 hypothetical protein [Salmonella enterica subsp. indica]HCM1936130.1 hypothetical protein [Salmonella enterica subsp. indica serovar 6,7:z41:1,7]